MRTSIDLRGLLIAMFLAASPAFGQMQTWTWVGDGSANLLSTAGNWSGPGTITQGSTTELVFGDSGSYSPTPYLSSGSFQIGSLTITSNGTGAIFAGNGTGSIIEGQINGLNVATSINFSPSGTSLTTTTNPIQVTGPLYLNGANVTIGGTAAGSSNTLELGRASAGLGGGSSIITSGGNPITKTGNFELEIGGDASGLGVINLNGGSVFLDPYALNFQSNVIAAAGTTFGIHPGNGATYTYSGAVSGSGGFMANSGGTVVLTGANTYAGTTVVNNGTLRLGADDTLPIGTTLQLNNSAVLDVAANQTIDHFATSSATTTISIESGMKFTVDTAGTTSSSYSGTIAGAGGLVVDGSTPAAYGASGTELKLSGSNLFTGGTTVRGGELNLDNSSGSALGTGQVTVNGGVLAGSGSFSGPLLVTGGGTVAPMPAITAGATTFGGGGTYYWLLGNTNGPAGSYWSLLTVNGTLTIDVSPTTPFNIDLVSFNIPESSLGLAANFDQTQPYSFKILSATSITGFSASDFSLNYTSFQNPYSGSWALLLNGNELDLNYTPLAVPEPSTGTLMAAGLAVLGLEAWRRRRPPGRL